MSVSLASAPRLHKLRRSLAEDVISGKEYVRRLRKQYRLLNPEPEWAARARRTALAAGTRRKKGRDRVTADGTEEGEEDTNFDEEKSDDAGDMTVKPLAKLLRSGAALTNRPDSRVGKRWKLRPGVVNIQRARDISDRQPVSSCVLHSHIDK